MLIDLNRSNLRVAGHFGKPHGIKGEISAYLVDPDIDLKSARCLFVERDGIMVPFFISSLRPKSSETDLVTIDGVTSEQEAREFSHSLFWLRPEDMPADSALDPDADGFYAADLIGFIVRDSEAGVIGKITDINDDTNNVLFIVTSPTGAEILIPVADEFIDGIDTESHVIDMTVPAEILSLNSK